MDYVALAYIFTTALLVVLAGMTVWRYRSTASTLKKLEQALSLPTDSTKAHEA